MINLVQLRIGIGFIKNQVLNRLSLLLIIFGLTKRVDVSFRNGAGKMEIDSRECKITLLDHIPPLSFCYPSGRANMLRSLMSLYEIYITEIYEELPVRGRAVIDVGAGIGDSTVYFAKKGASHIFAFEPLNQEFSVAQKNVKAANVGQLVTLFHESLGTNSYTNEGSIDTLEIVIERFHISRASIKIDCEGCEFELFSANSADWLKFFDHLILEYHSKMESLVDVLRDNGFRVTFPQPHISPGIPEKRRWYSGLIFAERE